jgi:hypothetical protein
MHWVVGPVLPELPTVEWNIRSWPMGELDASTVRRAVCRDGDSGTDTYSELFPGRVFGLARFGWRAELDFHLDHASIHRWRGLKEMW